MKKPIIEIIGWAGTIILIGIYALNSFGVVESTSLLYLISNLIAAIFLAIRVFADRNYSNLVLEIFWGAIAISAIVKFYFLV